MELKNIRVCKGLTQEQAAQLLGISRRTYIKYEKGEAQLSEIKLKFLCQTLEEYGLIDENHGILTLDQIREICREIFEEYNVEYCYLFGSYAKGRAKETSDIDLLVSMPVDGMRFFWTNRNITGTIKEKGRCA